AAQVEIYTVQLIDPARVTVSIDEPRRNRHSGAINNLGALRDQILDVGRAPHRDKAAVLDRKSLGPRLGRVDGIDPSADHCQIRPPRIAAFSASPARALRSKLWSSNRTGQKSGQAEEFTPGIFAHGGLRRWMVISEC